MSNKIPTTMLFCTTVVASACSKSNEKIAEDICNLNQCGMSVDVLESYGDDMATYLEECVTEGVEFIEELGDDDCGRTSRDFYICASNLNCTEYENIFVDENGPCAELFAGFLECQFDEDPEDYEEETYPADQYEPDNMSNDSSEIMLGESQERTLQDSSDLDYAFFTAEEGKTYIIETDISDDDETDTELMLYDSESTYLDGNDDKDDMTYESLIEWTAPASGLYMIEVLTLNPGPYSLILSES